MTGVNALAVLRTPTGQVTLRRAVVDDVAAIVELLAQDSLSATRDGADGPEGLGPYLRAFEAVDADPAHLLLVAEDDGEVVGTMQVTFLPGLARSGALRAQLEAVHVRSDRRSSGVGGAMVGWAIEEARRRGCALVQLTSNKKRSAAHRFYVRLGFAQSHEGFKLVL